MRLGVHRAEPPAAADRGADDERDAPLLTRDVPVLGGLVDERVHRQAHEVAEHDLDDRAQSADGRAERRARERELGDRRVEHARLAEALLDPRGDREHAALLGGNILAEEHDGLVALHLLDDRLADGGAELHFPAHGANSVARSAAGSG